MDRSLLFYFIFGVIVIAVPALSDRLVGNRLGGIAKFAVSLVVTVLACVLLVLAARPLGL